MNTDVYCTIHKRDESSKSSIRIRNVTAYVFVQIVLIINAGVMWWLCGCTTNTTVKGELKRFAHFIVEVVVLVFVMITAIVVHAMERKVVVSQSCSSLYCSLDSSLKFIALKSPQ